MSEMSERATRALAEMIEAVTDVKKAFGSPGDFGYSTREGKALARLYSALGGLAALADEPEVPTS